MELLLGGVILVLVGLLYRSERRFDLAEKAWRLERTGLLTRIQHPERVPAGDLPEPSGEVLHVGLDDDEAFHEYEEDQRKGALS